MRPTRAPRAAALAAALALGLAASMPSAARQDVPVPPDPTPSRTFGGSVEVTVVNLDVRVRDRDGVPVRGLGPADFEVLENGEPVPVSHFSEVAAGAPVTAPEAGQPGEQPPAAEPPPSPRLVLAVDDGAIHPSRRGRILGELARDVSSWAPPGTPVTVLRLDRGLEVVADGLTEPEGVRAALDSFRGGTGGAVLSDADFRFLIRDLDDAETYSQARALVRRYAEERAQAARATIRALDAAVALLGGLPGRTLLVYVGEGFPTDPGLEAFHLGEERFPGRGLLMEAANHQLQREVMDLVAHANAAGVTVSAYDARGLEVGDSVGADMPVGAAASSFGLDSLRRHTRQAGISSLAQASGGRFVHGSNSIGSLALEVHSDLTDYYSVGFQSRLPAEVEERRIEVRVQRPRVTVRHRSSFTPRTAAQRREDRTLAALYLAADDNPMGVGVHILEPETRRRRRTVVPLDLLVPAASLVQVPGPDGAAVDVEILVAARDSKGNASKIHRVALHGTVAAPRGDAQPVFRERLSLQLEPGLHRLAVTVHDLVGGATSTVSGEVAVP
jgi:VWFA-related protein